MDQAITSKSEQMMKALLDELLPGEPHADNHRPAWLTNPKTGRPLELDRYYSGIKIAFEFNGEQHYKHAKDFHRTSGVDLKSQLYRDSLKRRLCFKQKVVLCYVHGQDLTLDGMRRLINEAEKLSRGCVGLRLAKTKKPKTQAQLDRNAHKKASKAKERRIRTALLAKIQAH